MLKVFLCLFLSMVMLLSACGSSSELINTSSVVSETRSETLSNEKNDSSDETSESDASSLISSEQELSSVASSDLLAESSEMSEESGSGEVSEENSKDDSSNHTDNSSGEKPEEPLIASISSVNRSDTAVNLAIGKSYTTSIVADSQYSDDGKKLTDGKLESSFNTEDWAGYIRVSSMEIVLDLGKVEENIADFWSAHFDL